MSRAQAIGQQLFSTKQFVPGHVAGAAILLFGTIAIAKAFISRHEVEARANDRGQYGKKLARQP